MILSIITVTFNNEKNIKNYLKSVIAKKPEDSEVILVDNASLDKTKEFIKEFKEVILIDNSVNVGFSMANNQASKLAKGEYLLFLNPDTLILNDSINKLLSYAKTSSAGIISPRLVLPNGEIQPNVRRKPSILGVIKEYYLGIKNSFAEYVPDSTDAVKVECVYGGAMLIKRDLFSKIGRFNEKYFMYYEDLDLCDRIRKLGLDIVYYPKSLIKHDVGTSSKTLEKSNLAKFKFLINFIPFRNSGSLYYSLKSGNIYHGKFKAFLIRLLIFISLKLQLTNA